jgi:hypothetical protein
LGIINQTLESSTYPQVICSIIIPQIVFCLPKKKLVGELQDLGEPHVNVNQCWVGIKNIFGYHLKFFI